MSKNIDQIFIANPITSNASTDLMYFGQSPYGVGNDAAMTYANFSAQFSSKALTNTHIFVGNVSNVATDVAVSGDVALINTGAMTVSKINGVSISLAGSFITSGAFAVTQTYTNTTNVTFPTSGTLATTSQIPSLPLSLANGGTGASLVANSGGIFYSTGSVGAILGGTATANQILMSGSSTTPAWSTATYPATTTINQLLYSSSANTIAGLSSANSAVLVTGSTGIPVMSGTMTNGQLIIGSTTATPTAATLTQGSGITITNGAGSITIAATSTGITNVNQTSSSATLAANSRYATNNGASLVTYTIPAGAAVGDTYIVIGGSSGGWTVAQPASVQCHLGTSATTSGATGTISSSNQYDCCTITCVASNVFTVYAVQGNLTIV